MGFSVEFFVSSPVNPRHVCAVCKQVLDDPVICEQCNCQACRACCNRRPTTTPSGVRLPERDTPVVEVVSCPSCHAPCSSSRGAADIAEEINELLVRCPQSVRGCTATIQLSQLRHHVIAECSHTFLHCPHEGCPEDNLDRNNYESHVTAECEFRLVACTACNTRLAQRDLCSHQQERRCFHQLQRRRMVQNQQEVAQDLRAHRMKMLHTRHATEQMERRLIKQHTQTQQKVLRRVHSAPAVRLSLGNGLLGAMGSYRVGSAVPHFSKNLQQSTIATPITGGGGVSGGAKYSRPMSCRRCSVRFVPAANRTEACQYHRGPIIKQFGGTCMNCGKWRTVDGCQTGFHMAK